MVPMPVGIKTDKFRRIEMKKLLVVLLSLGLIFAFSMTASAQPTVKFGGEYYLVGVYSNNYTFADQGAYSRAYFHTRTRLQPVFTIAEGLTFTARMDALEKHWGDYQWRRGIASANPQDTTSSRPSLGISQANVQQNFEWERAFVTFKTAIGQFQVGYQAADTWGTAFGDNGTTRPRIVYLAPVGPVTLMAVYEKVTEADNTVAMAGKTDVDGDTYAAAAIYKGGPLEAGFLYKYYDVNTPRLTPVAPYTQKFHLVSPYMKGTFGPVYVEAEVDYFFGKYKKMETSGTDVDLSTLLAYAKAQVNLGPAYVGLQGGYASGNDPDDATKEKTYPSGGGSDWNPALILMSDDMINWSGNMGGANGVTMNNEKKNMILANAFAGFNVTPKFNIEGAFTWAKAAKTPKAAGVEYVSANYGMEVDVKATYKIYDNLSYMVGAGYLWVGDYFKGTSEANKIGNDYLLMNKLTLSF
jgi:hypothetical protein